MREEAASDGQETMDGAVQEFLPGTVTEHVPGIHQAAVKYATTRDRRMSLQKQEELLREDLERQMADAGCKHYRHGDVVADLKQSESVFVKIEKPKAK